MTQAYPLHWPSSKPRKLHPDRSRFQTTHSAACRFLMDEIARLGGVNPILSTNIPVRRDGLPYANYKTPDDRGVAVYFTLKGKQMCFACDRWDIVHDNIYAIGKTIDALRSIQRWGSGDMVQQAFTGFEALPAPPQWWEILGISPNASRVEIDAAYRAKARTAHPDTGGSNAAMASLNRAREEALRKEYA